ncbi:MAG: DNA primase [Cytophagales bacterium]|nr:DNA primase [Marinoscillum sp.]OUX26214.1 MAG: DNA primase [Flammeovirgaceae bacterium TMED262]|tara:strand:- start:11820 stop:13706 length:1887 start_codon:yes stop_codon:yes gene_type:complete
MINENTIQEIKERLDIVEVIGDFVSLKKSGSSYKALSPFTSEKTPSFFVSPSKQIFKCFSTGKGGDAIEFLKEVESMSYVESLKYLAEKYGVEIEDSDDYSPQNTEKESLLIILSRANEFFMNNLKTESGQNFAMTYLDHRGVNTDMIKKFNIGYSIEDWDSLLKHLIKNGFDEALIEKAGLIIVKDNKKYDRFRNRLMFPIHNITGKVIAFGARQIKEEKKQPKYINSPETLLYIKSDILYGLYQSKNEIRKEDKCYLVEGYTDVISLYQIGINNVVSSSGTSLTNGQIKLLSRYTKNITILYDGDEAGLNASLRGMDLILENDLNVKIVSLPKDEDPDSLSKKMNELEFKNYLNTNETDLINYKVKLLNENYKDDPIKKSDMIFDIVKSISKIPNSIKRSVFIKETSNSLNINENSLITEMNKLLINKNTSKLQDLSKPQKPKSDKIKINNVINHHERECVRMLVNYGTKDFEVMGLDRKSFIEYFLREIEDVDFTNESYIEIIKTFKEEFSRDNIIDINYFFSEEYDSIKNEVIDLSTSKYEISNKWKDKFNIHVSEESDSLKKTTYNNILRLKFRLVKKMINDNLKNLNNESENINEEEIMKIHNKLKSTEMEIAKQLGNVTSI